MESEAAENKYNSLSESSWNQAVKQKQNLTIPHTKFNIFTPINEICHLEVMCSKYNRGLWLRPPFDMDNNFSFWNHSEEVVSSCH
jgi:hypothetical protein